MAPHMKILSTVFFSFLIVGMADAQKRPAKFGDISIEDLKMTRYPKDSSASAVILVDYGESSLPYNDSEGEFRLNFERLRRIKILTKEGLKWADFRILLYHSKSGSEEKLQGLKAVTYNLENGKIVETKVKGESIFKKKYDTNFDEVTVTWPNVKEGSIIELSYEIASDFVFNFQDWEFQETIPVVLSEYRAKIPEYFNYDKYMQGYVPLAINEEDHVPQSIILHNSQRASSNGSNVDKIDYTENRFRWAAKDVPAFKEEPFITTYRDYVSKINFELSFTKFPGAGIKNYMGSWDDINKFYAENENFGNEVTGNGFLKEKVEEITKGLSTPEEKIAAIHDFVLTNTTWDGSTRTFTSKSFRKLLDEKKGNSAEINLLLASMLDKANIDVSPALLSTRDHGFLRESTAISSQFNYTICVANLDDKVILLDATEKLLPVGMLPERCLNGKAFVVSKAGYHWVELKPLGKSRTIVSSKFTLADTGELKGSIEISKTGYDALRTRKKYLGGEDDYLKNFLEGRTWELSKNEFKNTKDVHQPFVEAHDLVITDHVVSAGNILYLNPFILHKEDENPFKHETREYPVDFGSAFDKTYMIKISLPEGYAVEELPQSKMLALPDGGGKYLYNVNHIGNDISITSSVSINRALFTQMEYPNLREFYNQVVAKQAEQIVIKKK